jgi:hypothetical protein
VYTEIKDGCCENQPIPAAAGLRHGSVAVHLLGLRVRIPPGGGGEWMPVSCECCVL